MELILGIDLGTSYFKLGLFDRGGVLRGLGRVSVEADADDGSLCELPTERFWSSLREALAQALDQSGTEQSDIQALGYCSQANSFLLMDSNGLPLTPLVLWPDRRAATVDPIVRKLWQRDDFLNVTGIGIQEGPGFAVARMRWFQRHRPEVWSKTNRIMTISDYLVFSLTGQALGDEGTASLLGLWDLRRHEWWDEALQEIGVSRSQLSAPLTPGTVAGRITPDRAGHLGISPGTPLVVGSLDHHVAAIGAGIVRASQFSESTGTVVACLCHTDEYAPKTNCCMGPDVGGEGYYQLAFDNNGAGALEWYHRRHAPQIAIPDLIDLAEGVPIGSDGLLALPSADTYPGLEGFVNRSDRHQHGHFVRAIMESTAASLAALVDSLCVQRRPERIVATGGGARSNLWLQIKADLLGVEFVASACREPTCLGSAMLAAGAAGWFTDPTDAAIAWGATGKVFRPNAASHDAYALWHKRYLDASAKR